VSKKILVLGAGLVARPLVRYLTELGWQVTVTDCVAGKAEELVEGLPGATGLLLSSSEAALDPLVPGFDCTVSLLPASLHPMVAAICVRHGRPMVTASYISDAMRALHADAKAAGVTLLNEVGLDPGIDHMSAMAIIHAVRKGGGEIVSFRSYCGGLPAPDADDNPLRYKFSWSPAGVLTAATADARYLKDGGVVEVPAKDLFTHYEVVEVDGAGAFEGYPNRDSVAYKSVYGLDGARSLLRGTLRNLGHCDSWKKMVDLGLFSKEVLDVEGLTWASFLRKVFLDGHGGDLPELVAAKLGVRVADPVVGKMKWLGLFEDEALPRKEAAPITLMADRMWERMQYAPGERDMVVLQHSFEAHYPDRKERIVSTLVDYGEPGGDTSMARTVSLPAAIGVRMILEGRLAAKGVVSPVMPELYEPIMKDLEEVGVVFKETVTPL
jgi:saccharopine dehydrogenase (NADP+, L-glutamate forming)